MAQPASNLEDLLARLDSLDADTRLEALEGIRRYATTRKVSQAVFALRNDPDRRVRGLAREVLAEIDQRTSESLAVPGQEAQERDAWIQEMLVMLKAPEPTDRVTAIKELRQVDDPRVVEAIDKLKRDPNRVVRMLAEEVIAKRKEAAGPRPTRSSFEGNVMVSSPVSEGQQEERAAAAGKAGIWFVPWLGALYVLTGLPFAVAALWLWLGKQGFLAAHPTLASLPHPTPEHFELIRQRTGVTVDALTLAMSFAVSGFQTFGGIGLIFRRETGRKAILIFHASFFLLGMLLPGVGAKIVTGIVAVIIVYYLTRPQIVETFRGAKKVEQEPEEAKYGDMERKTW